MKYEYVNVETKIGILSTTNDEHRRIIDEYAKKGYRYVGYIPTEMEPHGVVGAYDLIFEKNEE